MKLKGFVILLYLYDTKEHNMSDTQHQRSKLFTPENLIMGVLIGGLAWGGTQIVNIKEAQASMTTKQIENDRVNEIVYESIPDIRLAINTISISQKTMNGKLDELDTKVAKLSTSINDNTSQLQSIPELLDNKLNGGYIVEPNMSTTIMEK